MDAPQAEPTTPKSQRNIEYDSPAAPCVRDRLITDAEMTPTYPSSVCEGTGCGTPTYSRKRLFPPEETYKETQAAAVADPFRNVHSTPRQLLGQFRASRFISLNPAKANVCVLPDVLLPRPPRHAWPENTDNSSGAENSVDDQNTGKQQSPWSPNISVKTVVAGDNKALELMFADDDVGGDQETIRHSNHVKVSVESLVETEQLNSCPVGETSASNTEMDVKAVMESLLTKVAQCINGDKVNSAVPVEDRSAIVVRVGDVTFTERVIPADTSPAAGHGGPGCVSHPTPLSEQVNEDAAVDVEDMSSDTCFTDSFTFAVTDDDPAQERCRTEAQSHAGDTQGMVSSLPSVRSEIAPDSSVKEEEAYDLPSLEFPSEPLNLSMTLVRAQHENAQVAALASGPNVPAYENATVSASSEQNVYMKGLNLAAPSEVRKSPAAARKRVSQNASAHNQRQAQGVNNRGAVVIQEHIGNSSTAQHVSVNVSKVVVAKKQATVGNENSPVVQAVRRRDKRLLIPQTPPNKKRKTQDSESEAYHPDSDSSADSLFSEKNRKRKGRGRPPHRKTGQKEARGSTTSKRKIVTTDSESMDSPLKSVDSNVCLSETNIKTEPGLKTENTSSKLVLQSARNITEANAEHCLNKCKIALTTLSGCLSFAVPKLPEYCQPTIQKWRDRGAQLQQEAGHVTETVVAVVGATGAGKSSLLNALLDERALPTSCDSACTACVVELRRHSGETYRAEIHFLSKEEWKKESDAMFALVVKPSGTVPRSVDSSNDDAHAALSKLKAVYGCWEKGSTPEKIRKDTRATAQLGQVVTVEENELPKFTGALYKYVESSRSLTAAKTDIAYWPLVTKVVMLLPNSSVLQSGLTLVDLPGLQDANSARGAIAQKYLRTCAAVWIVAPITRAVDDKTAKDLLGEQFRSQLFLDGKYGAVSFVCTKTDGLDEEEALRRYRDDEKVKEILTEKEKMCTQLTKVKEDLSKLENDGKKKGKGKRKQAEKLKAEKDKLMEKEQDLKRQMKRAMTMCRNANVTKDIRRDFQIGLKELRRHRRGDDGSGVEDDDDSGNESDHEEVEAEQDPQLVKSVQDLKVFCVSAKAHLDMLKGVADDGCFSTQEDTGIPQLQAFVSRMVQVQKLQGVELMVRKLRSFVLDMQTYIRDKGTHSTEMRDKLERLSSDIVHTYSRETLLPLVSRIRAAFQTFMETVLADKTRQGCIHAYHEAMKTVERWNAKQDKEKTKGYHWCTYLAIVRHNGYFSSKSTVKPVDWNFELTQPIIHGISNCWEEFFSRTLADAVSTVMKNLMAEIDYLIHKLKSAFKEHQIEEKRIQATTERIRDNLIILVTIREQQLVSQANEQQQQCSRQWSANVKDSMLPGYAAAGRETGAGAANRAKTRIREAVQGQRERMFQSDNIVTAVEKVADATQLAAEELLSDIESTLLTGLEPLWKQPDTSVLLSKHLRRDLMKANNMISELSDEIGLVDKENYGFLSPRLTTGAATH